MGFKLLRTSISAVDSGAFPNHDGGAV